MVDSPSAPPPPDPVATSAAQAKMNKETAVATYGLNATDQITPYGNLSYAETGRWSDGTPRFAATTTLSPEQQGLLNQQNEFGKLSNQLAIDQTQRLGTVLSQPVNLNNEATEARLSELSRKRLDPMFEQRRAALETDLLNRGITPGSEAHRRATQEFEQDRNDAYNQMLLTGRGQAVQEALTERNQPINEVSTLIHGGQVSQPNFVNTPQSQIAPVDYLGAVNTQYAGQLDAFKTKQSGQNALFGALGSLGGAALGGWAYGGFGAGRKA